MNKNILKLVFKIGVAIIILIALYYLLPPLLRLFLPFVLAYIVSSLINPLVDLLNKKAHIPRKIAALITLLVTVGGLGAILALCITRIVYELSGLTQYLPTLFDNMKNSYDSISSGFLGIYDSFPEDFKIMLANSFASIAQSLTGLLADATQWVVKFSKAFAMRVPSVFIGTIVFIMSSYFMLAEKDKMSKSFKSIIPKGFLNRISSIKKDMFFALGGYVKTQATLMSIAFIILMIGFSIVGIEYALVAAITISIFDALPFFGSGAFLIPWSLFGFFTGDIKIGIAMVALYLLIVVERQILEPKLLGDRIGIHPLITLMAMYVGLQLFGFFGLLFGPITVMIIKNLIEAGVFNKIINEFKSIKTSKESGTTNEQ